MNKEDKNIEVPEKTQIDKVDVLLNLLLSHKKDYIQDFLRNKKLPYSYTKPILKEKIKEGIENEVFKQEELIALLDKVEEFGNQHVYLYTNTSNYISKLRDEEFVRQNLRKSELEEIYNKSNALLLPDSPTVASIIHNAHIFKIKWVEKRRWNKLLKEEIKGNMLIKTYQIHTTRGVTIFRIDLVTGNANLFIQRLPSGTNYAEVKERYENEIGKIVDLDTFSLLNITSSVRNIENSGEVERRQTNFKTIADGKISFKSGSGGVDYTTDPSLKNARDALGERVSGLLGNFYWLPKTPLARKIHTHVYGGDSRVGIFGECSEQEVNYVLSRVRYFAR